MKVINTNTKEIITFTNVNTKDGFLYFDYQFDKKSPVEKRSIPFNLSNNNKISLCSMVWDELKTLDEWLDYIEKDNYVDWDSDLLDRNYRIFFTDRQVTKLNVHAPQFIVKKDAEGTTLEVREFDSKGAYVYLTRFDRGDPWQLCRLFGIDFSSEFECNPTLEVEPIDFSPNEEQQAMIDAAIQAEIDRIEAEQLLLNGGGE